MRSILALLFLGVISSTSAQCASDKEDQQQLCSEFCFISAQCNNQCSKKPSNRNIDCLCQDACVCAMTICNSCCAAAGSQFEQLFCQLDTPLNLNMCEGPGGQGRVANDNCEPYRSSLFTATAQFPPTIETFLYNVPFPTGVTFSSATCTSSDQSTPEPSATVTPSQTAAAAVSDSPSTAKASSGTAAAASSGLSAGSSAAPAQATGSPTAAATTAASATAKPNHGNSQTGGRYTLAGCLVGGGVLLALL